MISLKSKAGAIEFVVVLQPKGPGTPREIERRIWAPHLEAARDEARTTGKLTAARYVESRAHYDLGMPRPLSSGMCLGCGKHPRKPGQQYGPCCINNYHNAPRTEARAADGARPGPWASPW